MIRAAVRKRARATAFAALVLALSGLAGCASSTAGSGSLADDGSAGPTGTAGTTTRSVPTSLPLPSTGSAAPTTAPPPTTQAAPTTAAPPTTQASGNVVTFGNVRLTLTPGTTARVEGGTALCITLQNDTGCSLQVLDIGRVRAEGGSINNPKPGDANGWWTGSDVPTCVNGDRYSAVTRSQVVEKGLQKVGAKTAEYGSWLVSCQNSDLDFDPRVWWLPKSQIAFVERTTVAGTGAAVDRLLKTVTYTS